MSRLYNVTREEVDAAWKAVRNANGGPGADGMTIADMQADLEGQTYKIWNRLSCGSYQAQPVLVVNIPKAKGGVRQLGIPNVSDRVAQMVIKKRFEEILEPKFHPNSYAYRPGKSQIDAISRCREHCFRTQWVVEVDIKRFFDTLNHDLMMDMVRKHASDPTIVLYCGKFLKAKSVTGDGEEQDRTQGTPQGGVISPILANLYLHEVFDAWMAEKFSDLKWERYADDIIVHCVNEQQAVFVRGCIEERMKQFRLELHPEKTRIVYTGTSNHLDHRGHDLKRKFTFLGYDFKPRWHEGKVIYSPGMGKGALMCMMEKMKTQWCLNRKISMPLEAIAKEVTPMIRGWINYYGHYRRSELYCLGYHVDQRLVRFLKKKHKKIRSWAQGWEELKRIRKESPRLFPHWYEISQKRRAV